MKTFREFLKEKFDFHDPKTWFGKDFKAGAKEMWVAPLETNTVPILGQRVDIQFDDLIMNNKMIEIAFRATVEHDKKPRANSTIPKVHMTKKGEYFLIDGYHRIVRALMASMSGHIFVISSIEGDRVNDEGEKLRLLPYRNNRFKFQGMQKMGGLEKYTKPLDIV